eukprot:TRINITY_DN1469_c0_g1_i3.p1 TRINITY_DN1469_c0_g1~~TRINITY_DN1469_c0_g1_i3.p1  ORF type:complete len:451 (+),score=81.45 TRINITY_DN1469_c0_g1_i3:196-1353(+)
MVEEQEKIVGRIDHSPFNDLLFGGKSEIDILIGTPGKLVDHIQNTPGFTLQHLEFLVVDEADRLLSQSYQQWLPKIQSAAHFCPSNEDVTDALTRQPCLSFTGRENLDSVNPSLFTETGTIKLGITPGAPILRRILCSATLARNPERLAALKLRHPLHFSADSSAEQTKYSIPSTLREWMHICQQDHKPLALLAILTNQLAKTTKVKESVNCVVFTGSVETTHRLCVLLQLCKIANVEEYSGKMQQAKRTRLIKRCRLGEVDVIVSSDAMARGMDLDVQCVIQYDPPLGKHPIRSYVHRVGRTARAGKSGESFVILMPHQLKRFKAMLRQANNNFVRKYLISESQMEKLAPRYLKALQQLQLKLKGVEISEDSEGEEEEEEEMDE